MAIQVETFDVKEVTETGEVDKTEETIKLIETLGLKGQQDLVRDGAGGLDIIPYRAITKEEQFVYRVLCPQTASVELYTGCPIPLRVLQIISHARELQMGKLEVWSAEGAVKDPVLVAVDGPTTRLLARWGSELEDFGVLKLRAIRLWKSLRLAVLKRIQAEVTNDLTATEVTADDVIPNGADTTQPYYYRH